MSRIGRLIVLFISLGIFLAIGYASRGNFDFAVNEFWFVAGILLALLLSLVDQPHFSKDANIFVNAVTAGISLFIVDQAERVGLWPWFAGWAGYLLVSSCTLMFLRNRPLSSEGKAVQLFSRLNRTIGRPEAIFSAFFLWGVFEQFSYPQDNLPINSLLLFWSVFMILNVPSIGQSIERFFISDPSDKVSVVGVLVAIHSPRVAEVWWNPDLPHRLRGHSVLLKLPNKKTAAEGVVIDDRVGTTHRVGRIQLSSFTPNWTKVSNGDKIVVEFTSNLSKQAEIQPLGVVCTGSSIGELIFETDPRLELHEGQVVRVKHGHQDSYYQIVAAKVAEEALENRNASQSVRVVAGQLGLWDKNNAVFEPIDWVPSAGELVTLCELDETPEIPEGKTEVGSVPQSNFPVHIDTEDSITHNTALIGVTGSGKSYLAFHLIESYLDAGIKVLILDITRQHYEFLKHRKPTPLKKNSEVAAWLDSDSLLGIHQFADSRSGFPKTTADFVEAAFTHLQSGSKLKAGVDFPARLCVILEEAHTLVPEWNQVAERDDTSHVNRTARVVLQGRKFGMGSLLITQRTANVTKTILNQCNTVFALRSFDQTGLDFLRNYMGDAYSQAISTLPKFTAILVGKASSSARPIILKVKDLAERWSEKKPENVEVPKPVEGSPFDEQHDSEFK